MPALRSRVPAADMKDMRGFAKRASPFFLVRGRANGLDHSRFAVIVSVKVDRRSVTRHTLKRRTIAQLRARYGKDGTSAARDIVVTVLVPAKELQRKDFLVELSKLLPTCY